ncbi:MAG: flagellar basal body-associated FliL family protein [Proteobacteria bacterium]|nr:flagellar basal body-associated FliL family protein [Pseudomonadota bacterium]
MSAAAATATATPAKGGSGKKKLILIVAVVLLLVVGGAGAFFFLKKSHPKEGEEEAAAPTPAAAEEHKIDLKHPPTYMPLDPFVVNLADREADRYAQIGITLELDSPEFGEAMKAYMPAVRNAILLILARKTSAELLAPDGKEDLADEIMRESVRPMGIDIDPPEKKAKGSKGDDSDADEEDAKPKKKKKKKAEVHNPVRAVNFSNFIIQ